MLNNCFNNGYIIQLCENWFPSVELYSFGISCVISSVREKDMATHSSVLAWRIPGTGEPGGLPSWGRTQSDTTEAT